MTNEEKLETLIERVVKLEIKKVSAEDICRVCGFDLAMLRKIRDNELFKDGLAIANEEIIDRYDTLNDGWDMVENKALNIILNEVTKDYVDADYAMKAAMLANKAQRRGMHQNNPITPVPNAQVIIHLNGDFSQKLQQNFNIPQQIPVEKILKKDDNFLPPSSVGKMLGSAKKALAMKIEEDVDRLIPATIVG